MPISVRAMPLGTLLYRTSSNGQMYGYNTDELVKIEKGVLRNIFSGHVGIYIGQEDGVDYIVEALADGIVKVPAKYFVNLAAGEEFLGAKLPKDSNYIQQIKAVILAKNLADRGLKYDLDFKKQKGPGSKEWTCVGLVEKIYESADISNPNNLAALEYDENYYAIDITLDGFDNVSVINDEGDCFSEEVEFSKIARQKDMLIPAPELIGFNVGLEYQGERYIFLPYTQFLQTSLEDVEVDIQISSNFSEEDIRGSFSKIGLILKWSLINNPVSSFRKVASDVKDFAINLKDKVFSNNKTELVIEDQEFEKKKKVSAKKTTAKKKSTANVNSKPSQARIQVNKKIKTKESINDSQENKKDIKTVVKSEKNNKIEENVEIAINKIEKPKIDFEIKEEILIKATTTKSLFDKTVPALKSTSSNITIVTAVSDSAGPLDQSNEILTNGPSGIISSTTNNIPDSSSATNVIVVENTEEDNINNEEDNWLKLAIINSIYSTKNNDWIKLYNPTEKDFDLAEAGYRIEKTKTAEDPSLAMRIGNLDDGNYPGGTIIKSNDYYLIVRDDAEEEYKIEADAIATRDEFGWFDSGYTLYLGTSAISSSTDVDVIDAVGFGSDATYFAGTSPAPAIIDYYILNRIATTSDNNLDYELLATDKVVSTTTPEIEIDGQVDVIASSTIESTSIKSDNISHLWHFDECYSDGQWAVGKWGCARESGYINDPIIIPLEPVVDTNNFSVGFYYRKSRIDPPRINFKLINNNDQYLQFSLDQGLLKFDGLPNTDQLYYTDLIINDEWNQVVLVVDRDNNYWTIYINGEEKYSREFDEDLLEMNKLEISGDTEAFLIDELVFWNRPLLAEEILTNYEADLPYYPLTFIEPQKQAELLYYWNFNENEGETAKDDINDLELNLNPDLWIDEGVSGNAIQNVWGEDLEVNFNQAINSKDLSLSFWWRNSLYPDDSKIKVSLQDNKKDRLALLPNYYRPAFWFNDNYGAFSEGVGLTIPHDDVWHHLALTYNSHDYLLRFYVDGEEKFSSSFIWIEAGKEPDRLEIKSENNNSEMDELGVWQGVLTSEEIKEIYELYK